MEIEEKILDSNGNELEAGDSVTIIQNLKVKGSKDIKKGTTVKNIRIVAGNTEVVEGRIDGTVMVLKTCFLKKLSKKK